MLTRSLAPCLFLIALSVTAAPAKDGAAIYKEHCAACHDGGAANRAPSRDVLAEMSPERILLALESGSMALLGVLRTGDERHAVAEFLSGKAFGHDPGKQAPKTAMCGPSVPGGDLLTGVQWNGWGVDLVNSRNQSASSAGLTAEDVPRLKLKWAFGFPGDLSAYAQPTIVGGRIYVGSAAGVVYSLDAKTGCTYWSFRAEGPVRTAISVGESRDGRAASYFGDLHANVYAVDIRNGELLWKKRVETHPEARITGAPKLHGGRMYVPVSSFEEGSGSDPDYQCCTFRGSIVALDAASGTQIWKTYTISGAPHPTRKNKRGTQLWGPSGAGVWSSPTIDVERGQVYVATGDSYSDPAADTSDSVLALDMNSGKLQWRRQLTVGDAFNVGCGLTGDDSNCPEGRGPDFDFGSSPILVSLAGGRRALIAGQKSGVVHALDPDNFGKVLWQTRVGKGGVLGGVQWGPAADSTTVYVAVSDFALLPGRSPSGSLTPDPKQGGGLVALRLADGKQLWRAAPGDCGSRSPCSPAQSAAVSLIPGVVFSGSIDGHLRAYSTGAGKVLWDFDTVREYETANGVLAKGGSLDGPGPTIAGGMLYVNSGYGWTGSLPGNVLLAFSLKD